MDKRRHKFGEWTEWVSSQPGVEERERWCMVCPEHVEYQFRNKR